MGWYAWAAEYQSTILRIERVRAKGRAAAMSEDSLLERVTAAANERQLSQNTLTAYRALGSN